jgi:hydroxyethylthiazole kinase-like uncharacterized protein yjeF
VKSEGGFVFLTAEEMAELDRTAIEDFGIDEVVLMENAGAAVANAARRMLGGVVAGKTLTFLIGRGNNGGDGLVAARHLHNWGGRVNLTLAGQQADLKGSPAKQLAILEKMGLSPSGPEAEVFEGDLLVDALFGYNLKGNPREPAASMIRRANSSKIRILAVDIPSGLDATTGEPGDPCVVADSTVTLGLPKVGFLNPGARRYVGSLYVADISFPASVYGRYSPGKTIFGNDSIVKIW